MVLLEWHHYHFTLKKDILHLAPRNWPVVQFVDSKVLKPWGYLWKKLHIIILGHVDNPIELDVDLRCHTKQLVLLQNSGKPNLYPLIVHIVAPRLLEINLVGDGPPFNEGTLNEPVDLRIVVARLWITAPFHIHYYAILWLLRLVFIIAIIITLQSQLLLAAIAADIRTNENAIAVILVRVILSEIIEEEVSKLRIVIDS